MRSAIVVLGLCFAAVAAAAEPDVQRLEGAHYVLEADPETQDAQGMLAVLEAAYVEFERFFGAVPTLKPTERLHIRFFERAESWADALRSAGSGVPSGAGGYYWPPTRTAYLYRQPTRYFTRVLLLHEAAHQFHYLTRTRNREPGAGWYTEGIAEFLGWHRWDGTRLQLGVVPDVSLKHYSALVASRLADPAFDFEALAQGRVPADRPLAWALFAYVATGNEGRPIKGFETFCRKLDQGAPVSSAFLSALGSPRKHAQPFRDWVKAHPQPWVQVFNEWEGTAPGQMLGSATVVSACRLAGAARRLEADLEVPQQGRWKAGLLLHHEDGQAYTTALVDGSGAWAVDRRVQGTWKRLASGKVAAPLPGARLRVVAERTSTGVVAHLGGQKLGTFDLSGEALGLALDDCSVRFSAIAFELR